MRRRLEFYLKSTVSRNGLAWRSLRWLDHKLLSFKPLDPNQVTDCYIIDTRPLILMTHWEMHHLRLLAQVLEGRPASIVFVLWWTHESESRARLLEKEYRRHRALQPQHDVTFMCNTREEASLFERHGIPSVYCNQNALLDEQLYHPVPDDPKEYDAIYNARIEPFKRHHLARRIERLALLTYGVDDIPESYLRHVRHVLRGATWLNYPDGETYTLIPRRRVARCLSAARVGLCLSKEEGAMYASAEYLLCGLPIVSTRSVGGRDVLFDPEYVTIVDDDPEDVQRAVADLCKRNVPAAYIRNKTLEKFTEHRDSFVRMIQSIYDRAGVEKDFRNEFPRVFTNRMLESHSWSEIAASAGRSEGQDAARVS